MINTALTENPAITMNGWEVRRNDATCCLDIVIFPVCPERRKGDGLRIDNRDQVPPENDKINRLS